MAAYADTFRIQKVLNPIATVNVREENINFESDRTSSTLEHIQTKNPLSSKVSSSCQIPRYQTNATSKLNEHINKYINKLTLPYFNLFCKLFHIPFLYHIFDQRLFFCNEKFIDRCIKKLLKSRSDWLLCYHKLRYFPLFIKNSICQNVYLFIKNSKMSFLSHPNMQLAANHKGLSILALKVLMWFRIDLVYSIQKPVIRKCNFLNFSNVQRSSRNAKFDSYSEKGNPRLYIQCDSISFV